MPDMSDTAVITVTLNTAIDRVLEVDHVAAGAHVQGRRLGRHAAGKGVNVSRALAKLGMASVATGFVGREEKAWFEADLRQGSEGRIMPRLLEVDGPTRENITLLARGANPPADLHVREAGFEVARGDVQRLSELLDQLARPGDVVVFSGSLPRGVREDDLAEWVCMLALRGSRVALDTGGTTLRQVLSRAMRSHVRLWLVKPNAAELAACLGTSAARDLTRLAEQASELAGGVTWVAATAGALGAVLTGEGGMWIGRPTAARDARPVVNTVGCGDCFLAGLLTKLPAEARDTAVGRARDRAAEALRQALAVAAANTLGPGAADFDAAALDDPRLQADVRPADGEIGRRR